MTKTTTANDRMNRPLDAVDPQIAVLLHDEARRQATGLELIPSENLVSEAVLEALGSIFTNKYAEGYPGKRYYGGCEYADKVEQLAIDRAKQLFNCRFANVQPHSGANANLAAFMAMMQPGDRFLSINLSSGGHLSHGMKLNTSAIFYKPDHYELDPKTETIDFNHPVISKAPPALDRSTPAPSIESDKTRFCHNPVVLPFNVTSLQIANCERKVLDKLDKNIRQRLAVRYRA